jgi:hypothetical protein
MIIKDEVNNVFRSGVIQNTSFKIKSSAKAFKLLSSGVYTDKITAIIRELTCNGVDSHINAEKLGRVGQTQVPVLIHLPNDFEPFFSIRDYGTGISPNDMNTVYTTYFESTKTESNDEVGCFGIGGKSPYSYTDNFTVTSFFQGEKRVYSAYLNEKGEPDLAELAMCKSDESDGLEVSFAVEAKDFWAFNSKIVNVLRYFKVRPTIVGAEVKFPEIKYKFQRNNWGLVDGSNFGAKAIMGNVCYPLYDYTGTDLTPSEKALLKLNVDVFFDIGTLDVALSREHLSYDEVTKKNVKATLENIVTELREEINKEIVGCKTLWDAKLFFNELKSGSYSQFKDVLKGLAFDWNGTKVEDNYVPVKDVTEVEYMIYSKRQDGCRRGRSSNYIGEYSQVDGGIFANTRTVFFNNDLKVRGVRPRLEKYLKDVKMDGILVVVKEKVKDGIATFKQKIGVASDMVFGTVSTLPLDAVALGQESYNPKSKVSVLRYEGLKSCTPSAPWVVEQIDESLGGVYISMHHYHEVKTHEDAHDYVKKYLGMLATINVPAPVIYGVKPKGLDSIQKQSNWKQLKDFVTEEYRKYAVANNLQDKYTLYMAHMDFHVKNNSSTDYQVRETYDTINRVLVLCKTEVTASGKYVDYETHITNFNQIDKKTVAVFGLALGDVNVKDDVVYNTIYKTYEDTFKSIIDKAPMLKFIKNWNIGEPEVKQYLTNSGVF